MSITEEMNREQIRNNFDRLFKDIVKKGVGHEQWCETDIVFRNGKKSSNFGDVEFLMANHHNGSSFLYSSQRQGSSLYSVVSSESSVSFSYRTPS